MCITISELSLDFFKVYCSHWWYMLFSLCIDSKMCTCVTSLICSGQPRWHFSKTDHQKSRNQSTKWKCSKEMKNYRAESEIWIIGMIWIIGIWIQETRVWSLVQEDAICREATKPICHNYWASAQGLTFCNYCSPCSLEPRLHNKKSHFNEKPKHSKEEKSLLSATREKPEQQGRSSTTKNK